MFKSCCKPTNKDQDVNINSLSNVNEQSLRSDNLNNIKVEKRFKSGLNKNHINNGNEYEEDEANYNDEEDGYHAVKQGNQYGSNQNEKNKNLDNNIETIYKLNIGPKK